MAEPGHHRFPLVDRYVGTLLDVDLGSIEPGRLKIVEAPLRLRRQESYGFIHGLWWVWLTDGRTAVSAPPGAGNALSCPAEIMGLSFMSQKAFYQRLF